MYSLGGSLIGELDYHETFELYYYFFFEKSFFQGLQFYTQPLSICKNLAKRKFQRNGKIIEMKNKV